MPLNNCIKKECENELEPRNTNDFTDLILNMMCKEHQQQLKDFAYKLSKEDKDFTKTQNLMEEWRQKKAG